MIQAINPEALFQAGFARACSELARVAAIKVLSRGTGDSACFDRSRVEDTRQRAAAARKEGWTPEVRP